MAQVLSMDKYDMRRLDRLEHLLSVEILNPDIAYLDRLFIEYGIDVIKGRETSPWLFVERAVGDANDFRYPVGMFLIKFIEFDTSWLKENSDPVIVGFLERAKKLALDRLEKIADAKEFLNRTISEDFELGLLAALLFPLCVHSPMQFAEPLADLWPLIKERERVISGKQNSNKRFARTLKHNEKDKAYFALFDAAAIDYKPTWGGVKNFLKGLAGKAFDTNLGISFSIDDNKDIRRSDRKNAVLEGELNRKIKEYKSHKKLLASIEAHNKQRTANNY
jgi:hypothetical protein